MIVSSKTKTASDELLVTFIPATPFIESQVFNVTNPKPELGREASPISDFTQNRDYRPNFGLRILEHVTLNT
jgi:hypothetical protein